MSSISKLEIKREQNRLSKQRERQNKKQSGQIVDLADKKRRVIKNICDGKLVRSSLDKLGITIDMIPCSHEQIHPIILEKLTNNEQSLISHQKSPDQIAHTTDKSHQKSTDQINHTTDQINHTTDQINHTTDQINHTTDQITRTTDKSHQKLAGKPRIKITKKITLSTLDQIFDDVLSKKKLSDRTITEYKKRIKYISNACGCTSDDFIKCINDPDKVIELLKIKHPTSYKDDISPIITLSKYSDLFMKYVTPEIIEHYRQAMKSAIKQSEKKQADKANNDTCIPWEEIVKIRNKIARNEPLSQKHLLISLYTYIPCMRDDFGKVIISHDTIPPNNDDCFYFPKKGRLIINKYKTVGKYGSIDIILPKQLQHIIAQSLQLHPRDYLITKNNNTSRNELFNNGEGDLSNLIITTFGFGINNLRHSLETYIHLNRYLFTHNELVIIDRIMGHNANMALSYIRTGNINPLVVPNNIYIPSPFDKNTEITLIQSVCDKIGGNLT
jgi:hypothetical protein